MDLSRIPWLKMHDYLTYCGDIRNPKAFCIAAVEYISQLIPYDQARIYYLNETGKVTDEHLFGVDKKWTKLYHEYYSYIENGRYSLFANVMKNGKYIIPKVEDCVHNWTGDIDNEYITDYIRPQGLRYSFGIGLHDATNNLRCSISLDRTTPVPFNQTEIQVMHYLRTHIDNLYRNFYVSSLTSAKSKLEKIQQDMLLTARETEIIELVKLGLTTNEMSQKLFISNPTVYRHMANIYAKMNVNSRQELLLKILNN